uniref:Putative capsid protein n=1 Tax=viral metagenome TaxID=1070528 RepID=A0A6M3IPX8_9ZZZZ
MPSVIATGNHPKALWPGVKAWFGVGYGEHPEEFRDLFDTSTSDQAWEEDVMTSGFPLAQIKREGQARTYAGHAQVYTARYTHVAYSLGYIVTYEELKDNKYEKLSSGRAKSLGFSMRQTKENVGANVYNRAFNTNYTGGDGQILIVGTHPSAIGSQSNVLATAADISEVSLEDLIIMVMGATDHNGLKIGLMARSLHVPRQLWFEANRILKSTLQVDSANNTVNVLKMTGEFPSGIKVNHFFSDSDAYFVRTNCPDGMKHYQRDRIDLEQDNDFDTKNARASSYDRYAFGWSDWRSVYGTPGA